MKKIAIVIISLFLFSVLLCSCGREQMEQLGDRKHTATEFSLVDQYYWFDVIVDTSTGVMYARSGDGTLTVLVNADGSPRLYPGFDAKEDRYG